MRRLFKQFNSILDVFKLKAVAANHALNKSDESSLAIDGKIIKTIINEAAEQKNTESDILDTTVGLRNLGGNQELYKAVLNEYYSENKNTPDILLQAITEKRYLDASRIVHKIKSSSGSIGANKIYNLSVRLQKALNDNNENDIVVLHNEFSLMLTKLLRIIQNL